MGEEKICKNCGSSNFNEDDVYSKCYEARFYNSLILSMDGARFYHQEDEDFRVGRDFGCIHWQEKINHIETKPRDLDPICSCGKTASEHDLPLLLSFHHYWYFHKEPMKGCQHCKGDQDE